MKTKVVLVTGGSHGIGRAIVQRLQSSDTQIFATSRKGSFDDPLQLPLDVQDRQSVSSLFEWLDRQSGQIDVLVNNAGVTLFKPLLETSLEEWTSTLQTNLTGAFLCAQEAFRRMVKAGRGRIINIGSVADRISLANNAAYSASKHGLRALSQALTEEGKAHSVFSTLLSVGAVRTRVWDGLEDFKDRKMLNPSDVAEVVYQIIHQPLHVRTDEIHLMPPDGIL